jgi:hypothetical protein
LHELIARQEITDVVKRLARGTDRLDAEMIRSCYHPDGFDDHNSFRGSPEEFAAWVCEVLPHFTATHHFVADPLIRVYGDTAQADTYCQAHHIADDNDMVLSLRYLDRFERRGGRWLIARRVCVFDWTYTVPFDPQRSFVFGPDFTVGRRDRTDPSYTPVPGS